MAAAAANGNGHHSGSNSKTAAKAELIVWSIGGGEAVDAQQSGYADGIGAKALFCSPTGIAVDSLRDTIFVADTGNHRIRRFSSDDAVMTAAGSGVEGYKDGLLTEAEFSSPTAVCVDPVTGQVFVADTGNRRIRVINFLTGRVRTLAGGGHDASAESRAASASVATPAALSNGDGLGAAAVFVRPDSITHGSGGVSSHGNSSGVVYVGDSGTGTVRVVSTSDGAVSTLSVGGGTNAGSEVPVYRTNKNGGLTAVHVDSDQMLYLVDGDRLHYIRSSDGSLLLQPGTGPLTAADEKAGADASSRITKDGPIPGVYAHAKRRVIYVSDPTAHVVRAIDEQRGTVTLLAGVAGESGFLDTSADRSKFAKPHGVAFDGGVLYVVDTNNHCIRMIGTFADLNARKERGTATCRMCDQSDCVIA